MAIDEILKKEIVHYYDTCEVNYRRWWDLNKSLAMHAGYWDETTHSLSEALIKENEVLAKIARIQPTDRVLDAGCGVGGSSLYLAENIGCKVTGITLSERQTDVARAEAAKLKLLNPPEFAVMDFTKTTFPDASFDVVWAIESVCHASDKRDFIQEAWRLLRSQGRLIVADGFLVRNEYTDKQRVLLGKMVNGWAVESMESIPNFHHSLQEKGFYNITQLDATPHVLPSSKRLFFYSFPALALSKMGEYFGWSTPTQTRDFRGYHYQYWALRQQLCKYVIFCAKKP